MTARERRTGAGTIFARTLVRPVRPDPGPDDRLRKPGMAERHPIRQTKHETGKKSRTAGRFCLEELSIIPFASVRCHFANR